MDRCNRWLSNRRKGRFLKTLEVIERLKPDWVNVSKFGTRAGTEAAKLKPLLSSVVKERSREISELVGKISLEKNKEWLDWEGEVLISEKGKESRQWIGRNFAYKPILVESRENLLGRFVNVKITDATSSYLIGLIR